jgi:uridylate kinase
MAHKNEEPKTIVISLGGSVINPGEIDGKFIMEFTSLIIEQVETTNKSFIIICGGGKVAREYIKGTPEELPNGQRDLVGIKATWLNAQVVIANMKGYAPKQPSQDFYEFMENLKNYRIIVGGGFIPSLTTDEDAAVCADYVKSPYMINITNVDGIYEEDPRKKPEAKRYEKLSYVEYMKMVLEKETKPENSFPFTLIATKLAERAKSRVLIVNNDIEKIKKVIVGINCGTEIYKLS